MAELTDPTAELTDPTDIRETVRERYAAAANAAALAQVRGLESESGCCGSGAACCSPAGDEMLALARVNAAQAGVENVEFLHGYLENMPLPDASVDVVISNCVINLSGDKPQVIRESARVLRPGGRFAVSDVIADPGMDEQTRADMAAWTGCIAGALSELEFRAALKSAAFEAVEIRETHRVHEHAAAAIIRARKPPLA